MAVAWGIEPLVTNGVVTSGTSSQDVRKIWGSLYSEGVISGCTVSTSSTGLTYTVSEGVVAIDVGNNERVLAYVPKTTVTTGTVTANRRDNVYVKTNIPGLTNNIVVDVAQGTSNPSYSVSLGQFDLQTGDTNTANSFRSGSTPYSIPYGANLGVFYAHTDTSNSPIPKTTRTGATGSFTLPTDRKVLFTIDASLSALRSDQSTRAYRFDDAAYCEIAFDIYIDGTKQFVFRTPGLHQSWMSFHAEEYWNFSKGTHTVSYKTRYPVGTGTMPGYADRHYMGEDQATGITFAVRDAGVIV